jgi:cell division protein FtsW
MALDRFRANKANPDYTYLTLVGMLVLFGLVMISSSSVVISVERFNHNYGYVIKQSTALGIGIIGLGVASRIHYSRWRLYALPLFLLSLLFLLMVFIPGLGKSAKGAARWINIGSFQLQPSEVVKVATVLYLSYWLEKRGDRIKTFSYGFFPFILLLVPVVLILIAQRDMGTLLVILGTAAMMFYVAGATATQITSGVMGGVALVLLLVIIAPYRMQRLTTFFNPDADKLGAGYHINQSSIAIGSGGLWGRGFGKSLQKYLYLPEPHTDSIFAIVVEELGFFRSIIVLGIIALLAMRGYQIAMHSPDAFSRFVVFGLVTMLLLQAIINIGAIMGVLPLTGVPLPFISYGGTSLIMSLVATGIIINISRFRYG